MLQVEIPDDRKKNTNNAFVKNENCSSWFYETAKLAPIVKKVQSF